MVVNEELMFCENSKKNRVGVGEGGVDVSRVGKGSGWL